MIVLILLLVVSVVIFLLDCYLIYWTYKKDPYN